MILSKDFKIFPKIQTENPTENNLTMRHIDGRRSAPQNLIENLTENRLAIPKFLKTKISKRSANPISGAELPPISRAAIPNRLAC